MGGPQCMLEHTHWISPANPIQSHVSFGVPRVIRVINIWWHSPHSRRPRRPRQVHSSCWARSNSSGFKEFLIKHHPLSETLNKKVSLFPVRSVPLLCFSLKCHRPSKAAENSVAEIARCLQQRWRAEGRFSWEAKKSLIRFMAKLKSDVQHWGLVGKMTWGKCKNVAFSIWIQSQSFSPFSSCWAFVLYRIEKLREWS